MKTLFQFLLKPHKVLLSGIIVLGASSSVFAADQPLVRLEESFMKELRILSYALVAIALLIVYIAILLSAKDVRHLSIKYIWESIIGRNSPDPETDHEYDGIRELDNPMPAWLRLTFIGTIIFAFAYMIHFHFLKTGNLSIAEYEMEMAVAAETYKSVELPEDQLIPITDPGRLAKASTMFVENCATCHRKDLGGESGPNLTDPFWLHGGDVKAIYHTITNGVPGKSMISWKDRIPSQERLAIASFILSKQGTQPANPRAPEGTVTGQELPATRSDSTSRNSNMQGAAKPL